MTMYGKLAIVFPCGSIHMIIKVKCSGIHALYDKRNHGTGCQQFAKNNLTCATINSSHLHKVTRDILTTIGSNNTGISCGICIRST